MEEKEIFKLVTGTLNGDKVHTLKVPIRWRPEPKVEYSSLNRWEKFIGKKPKQIVTPHYPDETTRTFEIWPCIVSNQYRIAGLAAQLIKTEEIAEDLSDNFKFIGGNQPIIVRIVASAIQNNHLEPDNELIKFIENNIFGKDLYTSLRAAFDNYSMQSFTNSIVLMRGTVKILKSNTKTSPQDGIE